MRGQHTAYIAAPLKGDVSKNQQRHLRCWESQHLLLDVSSKARAQPTSLQRRCCYPAPQHNTSPTCEVVSRHLCVAELGLLAGQRQRLVGLSLRLRFDCSQGQSF
jgi:hypothetical protein